jgi:hypothetical protein
MKKKAKKKYVWVILGEPHYTFFEAIGSERKAKLRCLAINRKYLTSSDRLYYVKVEVK